jgi:hypothetical protein
MSLRSVIPLYRTLERDFSTLQQTSLGQPQRTQKRRIPLLSSDVQLHFPTVRWYGPIV